MQTGTTNRARRFTVATRRRVVVLLIAIASGVLLPATSASAITLPLPIPLSVINGTVFATDTGGGIAGICVSFDPNWPADRATGFSSSTTSLPGGLFLSVLPAGYLLMRAVDCRATPVYAPIVREWGPDGGIQGPGIYMTPGANFTGHVTDAVTGLPVAGINVVANNDNPYAVPVSTVTGPDGSYTLRVVNPGADAIFVNNLNGMNPHYNPDERLVTTSPRQTLTENFALTVVG